MTSFHITVAPFNHVSESSWKLELAFICSQHIILLSSCSWLYNIFASCLFFFQVCLLCLLTPQKYVAGQVVWPHYRNVFSDVSRSSIALSAYGVLTGKRYFNFSSIDLLLHLLTNSWDVFGLTEVLFQKNVFHDEVIF